MKESTLTVPSARLRTRSKFDLLLKTALEEQKLDQPPIVSEYKKEAETVKLIKKSKKSLSKRKEGIINETFGDGTNIELKPIPKPRRGSRQQQDEEQCTGRVPEDSASMESENQPATEKDVGSDCGSKPTGHGKSLDPTTTPNNTTDVDDTGQVEVPTPAPRSAHRKRKNRRELRADENASPDRNKSESVDRLVVPATGVESPSVEINSETPHSSDDRRRILTLTIHKVDRLKVNLTVKHPLVRVHLVDGHTGAYVTRKLGAGSVGTSVQPAMTQPFDMKTRRSLVPSWEEKMSFPADYRHLTATDSNAFLFFEILDFLSMSRAQDQYRRLGSESGWYRIAWAFLKLVGGDGSPNTDRKVQLQLFRFPNRQLRPEPGVPDLFRYWSSGNRNPYPSTLYVTVGSAAAPDPVATSDSRNLSVPRDEHPGPSSIDASTSGGGLANRATPVTSAPVIRWSKLPGQSSKIPNSLHLKLSATAERGSFALIFSNKGRLLAATCHSDNSAEILLYEIPSGDLLTRMKGHSGLVYSLDFSVGDRLLLSASSDGSARVWRVEGKSSSCVTVLPHPSYVYSAIFHPANSLMVVTSCFDTVVRVWTVDEGNASRYGQLVGELNGHGSRVNTLCFARDGDFLYSGDGVGSIREWNASDWTLCREIAIPELLNVSITCLFPHPTLDRIFVQSLDCAVRAVDLDSAGVIREFRSHLNFHEHIRGCVTPCGNFLFSGSEDHSVHAWNVATGVRATVYDNLPYGRTIHCVAYHPLDHLVAFGSYGGGSPATVYRFDHQVASQGVNLVRPVGFDCAKTDLLVSRPLRASTPMKVTRGSSFRPAETSDSATCYEKIMRKLDSVLETTNLRTELGRTGGGFSLANMLDFGDDSSGRIEVETPGVTGEGLGDGWPSRLSRDDDAATFRRDGAREKNVSALLTKSGGLAFLSGSDDSVDKLVLTSSKRDRRRRLRQNFDDDNSS